MTKNNPKTIPLPQPSEKMINKVVDKPVEKPRSKSNLKVKVVKKTTKRKVQKRVKKVVIVEQPTARERNRATKVEQLRRQKNVYKWITQGKQTQDIIANIIKHFELEERQAYRLLKGVYKSIYDSYSRDLDKHKAQHIARLDALYYKLLEEQQYGEARRVLADISKFMGTNAPAKVQHGGDPEGVPIQHEAKVGAILPNQAYLDEMTKLHEKYSGSST